MNIQSIIRPNIQKLKAYSSARSLYKIGVLLDANENPYNLYGNGIEINRYPDGSNIDLRMRLSAISGLLPTQCAVGNGSDELIDILFRIFCEPSKDSVMITSPTYGMYEVSANINNVKIIDVPLVDNELDVAIMLEKADDTTKIIFICSPNNPTGGIFNRENVLKIVAESKTIVVIDEAYADFMEAPSFIEELQQFNNLVLVRTLSKAYAMAGLRLGYMFANAEIIDLVQKVKPPYNVNVLTTEAVLKALDKKLLVDEHIEVLKAARKSLIGELKAISAIEKIYPTESNFILFRITKADEIFNKLVAKGVIIRSRTSQLGLENCLRISIGTAEQNSLFINTLKEIIA
jgi:histidinol-phosphate aminotransferase